MNACGFESLTHRVHEGAEALQHGDIGVRGGGHRGQVALAAGLQEGLGDLGAVGQGVDLGGWLCVMVCCRLSGISRGWQEAPPAEGGTTERQLLKLSARIVHCMRVLPCAYCIISHQDVDLADVLGHLGGALRDGETRGAGVALVGGNL